MQTNWQLDALRIAGLVSAGALLFGGMWLLWLARHRTEGERVVLPRLGRVGVPTALTLGLCALGAGYHLMAYSLLPSVSLWAIPIERWWVVAAAIVVAVAGALASERLEARHGDGAPPP